MANVPYVPTAEIPLLPAEARHHEPRTALDGGPDGLSLLRRVTAEADSWLAPGGHLLTETSGTQAPEALRIITEAGLLPGLATCEDRCATVAVATRPVA